MTLPHIHPLLVDGNFEYRPVPGSIKLNEEGVSHVVCINRDPDALVTECAIHTYRENHDVVLMGSCYN